MQGKARYFFSGLMLRWLLVGTPAAAQLPLPSMPVYAHYHSSNSSLPAELIYKIHADSNGYLWLISDKGLIRYNGKEFKLVKTGLSEDFIASCITTDNRLWLFAYSGHTAGIDLHTQKVINTDSLYRLGERQPVSQLFAIGIQEGNTLSLYGQGMKRMARIRLDTHKSQSANLDKEGVMNELFAHYRIPRKWQEQLRLEFINILKHNYYGLSVKDSFIIIGNKIFSRSGQGEATLYFNGDDYGRSAYIMGFVRRNNDLYLGSLKETGFYRIKGYFSRPRAQQVIEPLLPRERITSVEKDYLGNIWAATHGNGLFFFPAAEAHTLHYDKSGSGLYSNEVSCVRRFPEGITAVGYGNAVADFYQSGQSQVHRYPVPIRKDIQEVSHIEKTASRWLLFTRLEAFSALKKKDGYPAGFRPSAVMEEGIDPGYKDGRLAGNLFYYVSGNGIAIADSSGNISRHKASGFIMPKRTCLLPLPSGDFYFGTVRGVYYNETLLPYLQETQVMDIDTVNGHLLLATNNGVYAIAAHEVWDSSKLKKIAPGSCSAIRHDSMFSYLRCPDELIVIRNNTLQPVTRFSGKEYPFPFRLNDFCIAEDYLVLASNYGIFYIPKQGLFHRAALPRPRTYVLCSLNEYAPLDSFYQCAYRKDLAVLFKVDILDYSNERQAISCRLLRDGEELYRQTDMKEDDPLNFIPPGPGTYRIIYNIGSEYMWRQHELTYTLVITPLWYQQWWFIPLLILLVVITGSYVLYRIYDHKIKLDRRRLEQKVYLYELEAQSLLGQLKPHFIFNILTPLQGFFMRGEKIKGLDYLDNFSRLMRGMLNSIKDKYISLKNETGFIKQYLQIQQERFSNCFEYNIHIDPALDIAHCYIPAFLIQPLVENAVEHGMIKTNKDGRIDIIFKENGNFVEITVRDNGKGLPPGFTFKQKHALAIINERVQLLKKIKGTGTFHIDNNDTGKGVTAVLVLAKDSRL